MPNFKRQTSVQNNAQGSRHSLMTRDTRPPQTYAPLTSFQRSPTAVGTTMPKSNASGTERALVSIENIITERLTIVFVLESYD